MLIRKLIEQGGVCGVHNYDLYMRFLTFSPFLTKYLTNQAEILHEFFYLIMRC